MPRSLRRALHLATAVAFVLVAGTAWDSLQIRNDLETGKEQISGLALDDIRQSGLEATLAEAANSLDAAADRADSSPFLAVAAQIPFVNDQVDAVRDLTAAVDELGEEAVVTGSRIQEALDRAGSSPSARVEMLDAVLQELDRVESVASELDIGARGTLVGPVRDARLTVVDALAEVPERFDPLRVQVRALRRLLRGPSDYLVMVGNNAEMRAGAAMPLQIGVASIDDGDIELSEFKAATSELFTTAPTGRYNADIPEPLQRTYPRWMIGMDFPETAVVPDFPRTAPIFADIAADTQGWMTEGVIHIDAMALASLLEVVGPIEVGGKTYSAETAPQLVLNQTYIDFDGVNRRFRRDAQSDLAQALFDAIENRDLDLLDVLDALQTAAEGRHFMVWSRDRVLADLFSSFGADGAINQFQTLVSLQNTSANKLDWYVYPSVEVVAEPVDDDEWLVTLTTTVHHPDRELTVKYIEGPYFDDGRHQAMLTVQVPRFATGLSMPGSEVTEYGDDGSSLVIGTRFVVPRGETREIVTRYRLPREAFGIAVAPSARVEPVTWTVQGARFDDDQPFVASFGPYPDPPRHEDFWIPGFMGVLVSAAGVATIAQGARRAMDARLTRIDNVTGTGLIVVGFALALLAMYLAG